MSKKSVKSKAKPARKFSRWIRLYHDVLNDPKIGRLSSHDAWGWVRTLLVADMKEDGSLPPVADLAYLLRMSIDDASALVDRLIDLGLIDIAQRSPLVLRPHNWEHRQFKWDDADPTAAERMKRMRSKRNEQACYGRVTEICSESVSESVSVDREYSSHEEEFDTVEVHDTREVLS